MKMQEILNAESLAFGTIVVKQEDGSEVELPNLLNRLIRRLNAVEASPVVKFKKLHPDAVLPEYALPGSAGMDLRAMNDEPITLMPDAEAVLVPTGLAIELPEGYEAQIRSRSGMTLKGIVIANSPGTVDHNFSGHVMMIVRNYGKLHVIHKGDRIAQMVIAKAYQAKIEETDTLSETVRGAGGFGSSGER